jgi:hypothetical protein
VTTRITRTAARRKAWLSLALLLVTGPPAPAAPLDPAVRAAALRPALSAARAASELAASVRPPAADLDALRAAADRMAACLDADADDAEIATRLSALQRALSAVRRIASLASRPPEAVERIVNLTWHVRRLDQVLDLDDDTESFELGPVSPGQAAEVLSQLGRLREAASSFTALLERSPPDLMYRGLLITQMRAIERATEPVRAAVRTDPPWWTPDAYQGVVRIQRLIALTHNETRQLAPGLMAGLDAVWSELDRLVSIVNRIEGGARDAGPDARIVHIPAPGSR